MSRSRSRSALAVLQIAAALAVVAGAAQVSIGAVQHVVGHNFIWLSRDYVWMTPLGMVCLFLAAAVPLAALALVAPRGVTPGVAAFVFGTLGVLSIVLLIPGLHHLAALAVAVGVGTRIAGWTTHNEMRSGRLIRLATGLAVTLALVSGWREIASRRAETRQIARLPAAAAGAPNVLVIILDTVRAASMSFLGYGRETTPILASLGAEGAIFDQAYATAPWTLPSHAGMFTGRYPSQLSTDWREPLNAEPATLAEQLAERGYRTAGFTANHFYTSRESGLTRGFEHYEDYQRTPKQVLLSTTLTQTNLFWQMLHGGGIGQRLATLVRMDLRLQTMWTSHRKLAPTAVNEFLRWQAAVSGQPFLGFINLYDAHLPYDPPSPWDSKFSPAPSELDRYDGGIAYMDNALGALFGELRRRGVLDQTLVIVASDHGEGFGEHNLHGHGNSLYRSELHVPLVVRYPARVPPGTRVSVPVTLRDLAATALDVAGARPGSHPIPGLSWLDVVRGIPGGSAVVSEVSAGVNTEPHHPVSRGAMKSLVTGSAHYIRNGDAVEEVYHVSDDPVELHDLAKTPLGPSLLATLRDALARALR